MREIKFRAWDTEEKQFVTHSRVIESNILALEQNGQGRLVFQQYIGLKDKKGVEVYEGDIVKGKAFEFQRAPWIIGEVIYDYCEFKVKWIGDEHMMKTELNTAYEVIGNRWEHPHLLEGSVEE